VKIHLLSVVKVQDLHVCYVCTYFFYTGFQTFFMTLQNASIAKLGMHNWLKNSVFCVSIMSSNMGAGFILNYMWKILKKKKKKDRQILHDNVVRNHTCMYSIFHFCFSWQAPLNNTIASYDITKRSTQYMKSTF
jgi:hypothetical protein